MQHHMKILRHVSAVRSHFPMPGPQRWSDHRLKLSKRGMYGRAEFDLLRLRVLHQSKKSQDRKHKYKRRQGPHVDRLKKPGRMKHGTTFQHGKELLMGSPTVK